MSEGIQVATLAGAISLTPDTRGLLLPVFVSPRFSNAYLIQRFSTPSQVDGFVELTSVEVIHLLDAKDVVSIGEEPLWIFRVSDGLMVIERTSNLLAELTAELERNGITLGMFENWEVQRLFGSLEARQEAVDQVVKGLSEFQSAWANYWLDNLLVLPSIRQELASVFPQDDSKEDLVESLATLSVECSGKEVKIRANSKLSGWLRGNPTVFATAMKKAADAWRKTKVGTEYQLLSSMHDVPQKLAVIRSAKPAVIRPTRLPISMRVVQGKGWLDYDRRLAMSLAEAVVESSGADYEIRRQYSRVGPMTGWPNQAPFYELITTNSKSKKPRARKDAWVFNLLGGLTSRSVRKVTRGHSGSKREINIAFFRTKAEAEEVLVNELNIDAIDQVWIGAPEIRGDQSLRYLGKSVDGKIRYLGYLSPPLSAPQYPLRSSKSRDTYTLVISDGSALPRAMQVVQTLRAMDLHSISAGRIILCLVAVQRTRQYGLSSRMNEQPRGRDDLFEYMRVDTPPAGLVRGARHVVSLLPPFWLGALGEARGSLVLANVDRQGRPIEPHQAEELSASFLEIDASKGSRTLRKDLDRAISIASKEVALGGAKRRYRLCLAGRRAIHFGRRLIDES